jgi:hypothetical protein
MVYEDRMSPANGGNIYINGNNCPSIKRNIIGENRDIILNNSD